MRIFLFLHLAFSLVFFSGNAFAQGKVFGILVQVKDKKVLHSKELKALIKQNGLTSSRYFTSLKVQSYKLSLLYFP